VAVNMKKMIVALLLVFFPFAEFSWGDVCGDLTDDVIKKQLDVEEFRVVSKREVNGVCELIITINSRLIPFYGNRKYLVSGEMYVNGVSLTRNAIYNIIKTRIVSSLGEVNRCVVFSYNPPEIRMDTTLYMFTDPLCPFCNKISGEIRELSDRLGFKVKVLLLNVHGERGRVKCIEAICRNSADPSFNFIEYNRPGWKKKSAETGFLCKEGGNLLDRIDLLSEKIGIDSVPFFFVDDGRHVSGASIEEVRLLFNDKRK